jgi:molybdopterin biosynthesis enzyme
MTAGAGVAEGRPVLLLPGRAEDALAAWILLARPLLDALAGAVPAAPLRLRLTRKVPSTVGLAELVPLRLGEDGGAEPLAVGALPLGALSAAGALHVVPPGSEGYEAGTEITALPL